MLQNLTYKKKNRLLILAAIFFACASYSLAFKRTIQEYSEAKILESKSINANETSSKLSAVTQKLNDLGGLAGDFAWQNKNEKQTILGAVTTYCQANKVVLREFPKSVSSAENGFQVETYIFNVEGGFIKLLQLVYEIEQKKLGRVSSARFKSEEDLRTKTLALTVTIYIQTINKIQNESKN